MSSQIPTQKSTQIKSKSLIKTSKTIQIIPNVFDTKTKFITKPFYKPLLDNSNPKYKINIKDYQINIKENNNDIKI